jgi:hypothetical protein
MYALALVTLFTIACGTGADEGGGARGLPIGGGGPFRPLEGDTTLSINAPYVLTDARDVDSPAVVADGDALAIWVARRAPAPAPGTLGAPVEIAHADSPTLLDGFGPLDTALVPSEAWEAGIVDAPAVLPPRTLPGSATDPWLLAYRGGGGIGLAVAADGHTWRKLPGPVLAANVIEEGNVLGTPAIARLEGAGADGRDGLRLYYVAAGAVWAADANVIPDDRADASRPIFTRVDARPSTPERDPIVAPGAFRFLATIEHVSARSARTATGRVRHDLWISGSTGVKSPASRCGYAASFDGLAFEASQTPILPKIVDGRGPASTPYRGGALLVYVQRLGSRDAVAAALAGAVD